MAILTTLNVDLGANTVTLNSTFGGNLVNNLVYTQSTHSVVFAIRPAISISEIDFQSFLNQLRLFQTSILANFPVNQFATTPFTSVKVKEVYDPVLNLWELDMSINAAASFIVDSGALATRLISLNARTVPQVLNFSEWSMVLNGYNHYGVSLQNYLG